MHIYPWQTDPTPSPIDHKSLEHHQKNKFHIYKNADIPMADRPHPLLQSTIDPWKTTTPVQTDPASPSETHHRPLKDHYTNYVSHIEECTDTSAVRPHPSSNNHISMEDHYTKYVSHIEECTDTSTDRTHPSSHQPYICGRPLHQISFIYSRIHIYQCRQTPSSSSNQP